VLLACSVMFAKVFYEMNEDDNEFLICQKQEGNQYKRMVNSIDQGFIVL